MSKAHIKTFYIIFNPISSLRDNYCKVEATVQADAEIYANHYFQNRWSRILSSGQWWEYKQNKRHLMPVNPEKEQQNVN